jgi:uncharacterized protein YecE (DUF72 family)
MPGDLQGSTQVSAKAEPRIRIGVGGWTYAPWRGAFYPHGLAHKRELEYASGMLTSIEINGTYYGSQKPDTFARWHDETPADFVFALKAPRFVTARRVLSDAGPAIERFFASGVMALGKKLGPINWQMPPTKAFDPVDFAAFLKLLPKRVEGQTVRHAVELRHDTFRTAEVVALVREHGVAIVLAGDARYPQIADLTAPFVYARIMGTTEAEPLGYSNDDLDRWVERARLLRSGTVPPDLATVGKSTSAGTSRDVFLYVISGFKVQNPSAAMAMIERLGQPRGRHKLARQRHDMPPE